MNSNSPGEKRDGGVGMALSEHRSYAIAIDLSKKKLASLNPFTQADYSGVEYEGDESKGVFKVQFLGKTITMNFPECEAFDENAASLSEWHLILALHYLALDIQPPAPRELISFTQVPSGSFYDSAFQRRAKVPLVNFFGRNPGLLRKAAEKLGWPAAGLGDFSVVVPVFPKVKVTLVIWAGDAEFPPDGNVLFEDNISRILPTEDIAVIGGLAVSAVIKTAKTIGDKA